MSFRPQGIPVTNVTGMPMTVNYPLVGQPVMMPVMTGQTMIVRQPLMTNPGLIVQQGAPVRSGTNGPIVGQPVHDQQGPPVTVFVGNISEKATDTLVRQILMKCGTVNNWKRVQGMDLNFYGWTSHLVKVRRF